MGFGEVNLILSFGLTCEGVGDESAQHCALFCSSAESREATGFRDGANMQMA